MCQQVLIRMQHYKDDLLASCLRLVLSLPLELVQLDVASLVPAMKVRYPIALLFYAVNKIVSAAIEY